MAFFLPKHSSAATARLTSEVDPATPIKPSNSNININNNISSAKRNKTSSTPRKHRRLESDFRWDDEADEALSCSSSGSHGERDTATKSTSFSSESGDDDDDDDDDDSDDDYDSDDDEEVDRYSLPAGIAPTDVGSDGNVSDGASITSGSTSSSGGLSHNSLLNDVMNGAGYYNDGDLHTLNSLVNRLHAEELKRESKSKGNNNSNNNGNINEKHPYWKQRPRKIDTRQGSEGRGDDHNGTETQNNSSPPISPVDLPSELPENPPPHFSPLQTSHRLSISAVDSWRGPSLEIVPTESVEDVMPILNDHWSSDRLEWEEKKKLCDLEFKRSRTANDAGLLSRSGSNGIHRRNRSMPNVNRSPNSHHHGQTTHNHSSHHDHSPNKTKGHTRSASMLGSPTRGTPSIKSSSSHRNYKYGKPPTLPNAKNPNPMVSKSSKKIHKKHARYALTAGMMLGIRESVGGATGVENELEIRNWEGWEFEENVRRRRGEEQQDEGEGADGVNEEEDEGEAHEVEIDESQRDMDGSSSVIIRSTSSQDAGQSRQESSSSSSSLPRTSSSSSPSRSSSASTNPARNNNLTPATTLMAECERVSKYKFPSGQFYLGSNTAKPLPHKYKFKVYAPLVFARIRSLFGVEKQTFLHSICGKFNFYEFASNARSGQFFFYSHDGRYMIKTLTYTESKFLREILPHYYRHLTRYPSTFLTHFYGMYRVCMPNCNNQRLHFIIMRSVFHTEKKIDRVWDLKGSKAGRRAGIGDAVGKDLDILEEGRKLRFAEAGTRAKFLEQLARDATFMARLGIMDYSLLLGLHEREGGSSNDAPQSDENDVPSAPDEAPVTPRNVEGKEEPERSNTPFRRGIIQRASSAGDTKVGNDGFKALEACNQGSSSLKSKKKKERKSLDSVLSDDTTTNDVGATSALGAIPESPGGSESGTGPITPLPPSPKILGPPNAITSRPDSGIEGYGVKLKDGTLAKREIYFCGVIDILQYYNARKMGETVMRKAAGNAGQDISCVDPETYGKRFVKFISNLVEE